MKIESDVITKLEKRGIQLKAMKTRDACGLFNRLTERGEKVVAALHLTC